MTTLSGSLCKLTALWEEPVRHKLEAGTTVTLIATPATLPTAEEGLGAKPIPGKCSEIARS